MIVLSKKNYYDTRKWENAENANTPSTSIIEYSNYLFYAKKLGTHEMFREKLI